MRILPGHLILFLPFLLLSQNNTTLNLLFEKAKEVDTKFDIANPIYEGKHPLRFPYQTKEQLIEKAEALTPILVALEAINTDLSEQDEINRQIRILQIKDEITTATYQTYLLPMNAEGGFYNAPAFFLSRLPFRRLEDYESYLRWLPSFAHYLTYNRQLLKDGVQRNIQLPKVLVHNTLSLLEKWTADDPMTHPFYDPIVKMPASFPPSRKQEIETKAKQVLRDDIIPAYQTLERFLKNDYLHAAPNEVGVRELPNGKAYYENRIRHYTTLDISPDSVFNTGLSEVKRIKGLMEGIIADLSFEGDFNEFLTFLRTDPQFYPSSPRELLSRAAWISKKAEGKLPRLFSNLYTLPFTVDPVPEEIAPNYTTGRYLQGNRKQNRPGTYWVNTYNLNSRTLYTLPALTLHEAVPGHHLQITLASEIQNLPEFRSNYYISAYGEGWGLYAEYLGEEMGMYTTPYELFGRYTYEMWRACRLVVDVGIHYKSWSREQAVQFMASNTALSIHEVNTEIDRYIGWPGQAVSYKIGELVIKSLRKEAEEALGEAFDIQVFHHEVLKDGAVPLSIVKRNIRHYIKSIAK
ncbi:MAG: DUF885 domain-containing protein [Bacteroidota bacterium]